MNIVPQKSIGGDKVLRNIITFEKSVTEKILPFFGYTIDDERFIVEENDPTQRVITPDGEEVKLEEFAGLTKDGIFKSDLPSLINLSDKLR